MSNAEFNNKTEFTAYKLASIDAAAADHRLTDLAFRLLWVLASATDGKTGVTREIKQTELAEVLGCGVRAVQINRDDLVRFGYLEPIGRKPGKYVNRYRILKPKKANVRSPIEENRRKGEPTFAYRRTYVPKGEPSFVHVLPFNPVFIPSGPSGNTELGAPRLRADALGAPLGHLQEALHERLGDERMRLLAAARLLSVDAEVIRLQVLTRYQADEIVKHCLSDILDISRAKRIEFEFAIKADPFNARGRL